MFKCSFFRSFIFAYMESLVVTNDLAERNRYDCLPRTFLETLRSSQICRFDSVHTSPVTAAELSNGVTQMWSQTSWHHLQSRHLCAAVEGQADCSGLPGAGI